MFSASALALAQALLASWFSISTSSAPAPSTLEHWRLSAAEFEAGSFRSRSKGRALRFDGTPSFCGEGDRQALLLPEGSEYLVVGEATDPASLPRERLSVEAWVALDKVGDWGGFLGALEDNGSEESGWLLGNRGPKFVFAVASEGAGKLTYLTSKTNYRPGRWYHVVGTYDGKVQRIYVDGVLGGESREQSGPILYAAQHQLVAGAYKDRDEDHRIVGALHELKLHDSALSERKVAKSHRALAGALPAPDGASFTGVAQPVPPQLAKLQPAINAAIDRGVEQLLREQHRDGSWEHSIDVYRNGQTALCAYTLLKSGLSPEHPSLKRAFAFLRAKHPRKSYSTGFQLLAIAATGDPAHEPWVRELAEELVDWENDSERGAWGYPEHRADLSNTQIVALGLWAAAKLGVETRPEVWLRLVERTLEAHQMEPMQVEWPGEGRSGKRRIAGFSYYAGGEQYPVTGSMTVAGLCILKLGEEALGKALRGRLRKRADEGALLGLNWLEYHWTVEQNPGKKDPGQYLHYYLYGLERVGALFELERIGEHAWYPEGAQVLIEKQHDGGDWGSQAETCFALLFLSRATHPSSGPQGPRSADVHLSEGGEVTLKVTGRGELVLYVEGFDAELLAEYGSAGLRVVRVEYLIDGEVFATVEGDPTRRWEGERYARKYRASTPGERDFQVRVWVLPPEVGPGEVSETEELLSGVLRIATHVTSELWMTRMNALDHQNLLAGARLAGVSASTRSSDGEAAEKAVDGLEATRWLCAPEDPQPWLRIQLDKPVRASAVLLAPAASKTSHRGSMDRPRRITVRVNKEDPLEVLLAPEADELDPVVVPLPKRTRVRSLEVRIEERDPLGDEFGRTGFAEVGLLDD